MDLDLAGFVQYLDPSEPIVLLARLEGLALFAPKVAEGVGARFATQGWTWSSFEPEPEPQGLSMGGTVLELRRFAAQLQSWTWSS